MKRKKKGPAPDPSEFEADVAMLILQYGKMPEIPNRWAIADLARKEWIERGGYWGGCKRPKYWIRAQDAKAAAKQYLGWARVYNDPQKRQGVYANIKHTPLGYPESWVVVRFSSDRVDVFPIDVFMENF